jgi:hypothetical protein
MELVFNFKVDIDVNGLNFEILCWVAFELIF